jgi:elongation factor Ts
MTKVTAQLIREVREETGAPMARTKKVLDEQGGDRKKASEILKKEGFEKMEKRQDRDTTNGIVVAYSHHTGKVATLVELLCETDFVAKNEVFVGLANDIAMQVSAMNPKDEKELLKQEFIKDPGKTIEELIKEATTKTGEVLRLGKFERIEVGK